MITSESSFLFQFKIIYIHESTASSKIFKYIVLFRIFFSISYFKVTGVGIVCKAFLSNKLHFLCSKSTFMIEILTFLKNDLKNALQINSQSC
jgi:hypothetical protein